MTHKTSINLVKYKDGENFYLANYDEKTNIATWSDCRDDDMAFDDLKTLDEFIVDKLKQRKDLRPFQELQT